VFLADDIILFPFKGILSVFQEIYKAALEEIAGEADRLRNELSHVYQLLEQGAIAEDEFDATEKRILDRLDEIDDRGDTIELGEDDDENDYGEAYDEADPDDADDADEDDDGGAAPYEYVFDDPENPWAAGGDGPASLHD
jgi:hypothetical protein